MAKYELTKNIDAIENDFSHLNKVIDTLIQPYCKSLDNYVRFISKCLKNKEEPPTTGELEDFCMWLATELYWASTNSEHLGIKDDISRAIYKEVFNRNRDGQTGTVKDKDSLAELASQQEYLTNMCYSRAYKIMKAKVENAQELLSSCKKVLSHRMQEEELTRIGGNQ